jgi:Zn ribbon nucleic-acid-binding protein
MKVTKRYNQNRRDLTIDLQCENCGNITTRSAYDDYNFWANVVPNIACVDCGKSSKDIGETIVDIETRYPEGEQV